MRAPWNKIGLGLAAFAVMLLLAEIAVRVFGLGPDVFSIRQGMAQLSPNPGLRFELVPGYVSPARDVVISRQGWRDRDYAPVKSNGATRIACAGDSIAFGMGAAQDVTFSRFLEAFLQAAPECKGRTIEAMNMGVPGYNAEQVEASLDARIAPYRPDLVLYLFCLNDAEESSGQMDLLMAKLNRSPARRAYVAAWWNSASQWLGGSRLWMLLRYAVQARREIAPAPAGQVLLEHDDMFAFLHGRYRSYFDALYRNKDALGRLGMQFRRMSQWSRERQIPLVVAFFPLGVELDRYPFEGIHKDLISMAASNGLSGVDLLPVFQAASKNPARQFFADPIHPNADGYELAARAVGEQLLLHRVLPGHRSGP